MVHVVVLCVGPGLLLSDCGDEMVKRCRNGEKAHNPEVCPLGDGELSKVQLRRLSSLWQLPARLTSQTPKGICASCSDG